MIKSFKIYDTIRVVSYVSRWSFRVSRYLLKVSRCLLCVFIYLFEVSLFLIKISRYLLKYKCILIFFSVLFILIENSDMICANHGLFEGNYSKRLIQADLVLEFRCQYWCCFFLQYLCLGCCCYVSESSVHWTFPLALRYLLYIFI